MAIEQKNNIKTNIAFIALPVCFCLLQVFFHKEVDNHEINFYFTTVGGCIVSILTIMLGGIVVPTLPRLSWIYLSVVDVKNKLKRKNENI